MPDAKGPKTPARAAAYVRISDDRLGDAAGVGRQETDCRALAERHGWTITDVYTENDTSAYKRRKIRLPDGTTALRVDRPAFRRLLTDLASGAVDCLVAYDLDRIARDIRDLEDLIDIVESHKIPTAAVTGNLDLSTDSGILVARINVAVANKSSRDTGRRVARKHLELAEQGRSGGGGLRAYGYNRDGTIIPDEAETVRWIADRVLAGASLKSIANDLQARGVPTVRGGPWNLRSVHAIVTKPRVAGLRDYKGEVVGPSTWPPILDRAVWEQVRGTLADRAASAEHSRSSLNRLVAWLTGILLCERCGHGLSGAHGGAKKHPTYLCKTVQGGCGRIVISRVHVEDTVAGWILDYIARPDVLSALLAATTQEAAQTARADAAADEAQLSELAQLWGERKITTKEYLEARRPVEARLKRAKQIMHLSTPSSVRALLEADSREAAWEAMEPWQKRDVARAVFPHGIGVNPSTAGRFKQFDATRLVPRSE